ncbi:helix-turn-helix domain-containing protein [Paenibacillus doosanensis]|uniref:helix-turn-helix domain-containing protein n=1 Tax=Paenibacillus doosanensis TaxID=1229154 RepID=UPI00217FF571|nr:helix-turn-helix domain-containing protein [Paenibacillus doosanensis]
MINNRWFLKMLFSYLPIFYIVIAVIFLISVFMINESSQKQTLKTNVAFANHVVSILEQSLKTIDGTMIKEIDQNDNLKEYLYTTDKVKKYYYANKVSDAFNNIVINNKWIHSVYLYNIEDQTVLSSDISTKADSYGDEAFIRELQQGGFPKGWTNKREYRELEYDKPVEVFSLVKPFPLFTAEKGFIVINVNVQSVKSMLDEMTHADISHINLYDSQGQRVFGSGGQDMSLIRSGYLGWAVGTSIKETGLLEWTSAFSMWWLVFGLCAIILGTLAIVFISLKHSKPIEDITHQIHDYVHKTFGKKGRSHDFHFIQSALDKLIKESNKSQEHYKQNLAFRRRMLFQELLKTDPAHDKTRWGAALQELGRIEDAAMLSAFVVEIDDFSEFCAMYNERDQGLLGFALGSAVKEIMQDAGADCWREWIAPQRLGLICFLPDDRESALPGCWDHIRTWIGQNLKFTVTLGVTDAIKDAEQLHVSFKKALEALDYKPVFGSNTVIRFEDIDMKEQGEVFDHLLVIRSIGLAFREGDRKWETIFDELVETLRANRYSRTEIANLLHYLIYQIYKDISGLPREGEDPILELNQAADTFETIDDIHEIFKAILVKAAGQLHVFRSSQNQRSVVHDVRAYIEANYGNPDLSLSLLGDTFHMNPSYLSRLFKEEFDQNFVDFLARIRVEQAKTLLRSTNDSLQDIAAKVGYTHYYSFSRVFKKLEKVSAGDYRKMM